MCGCWLRRDVCPACIRVLVNLNNLPFGMSREEKKGVNQETEWKTRLPMPMDGPGLELLTNLHEDSPKFYNHLLGLVKSTY